MKNELGIRSQELRRKTIIHNSYFTIPNFMSEAKKIITFTDLDAWKEGHALVLLIYEITKLFPKDELFGLVSQMRRCAVSITSNIAEGFSRQSYKEKVQFYSMTQGSVTELQNQLLVTRGVGYITVEKFQDIMKQSVKVHKIVNGLIKRPLIPYSLFNQQPHEISPHNHIHLRPRSILHRRPC